MSALPVNNSKELCRLSTPHGTKKSFADFQHHKLLPCNNCQWTPSGCHGRWHVGGRRSDTLTVAAGGGPRRQGFLISRLPGSLYTLQNNVILMLYKNK